jgi:hypothetical protein
MVGNNTACQTDSLGLLAGFIDCCPNEEKALIAHEQTALNQMKTLLEQLDAAITSPNAKEYPRGTVRRLELAKRVVTGALKRLPKLKVRCVTQENSPEGDSASMWPGGWAIHVYRYADDKGFWMKVAAEQAADLVHETTHSSAWTHDSAYFYPFDLPIRKIGFIDWPSIASTYDTWILAGFCIPGYNCKPGALPYSERTTPECKR